MNISAHSAVEIGHRVKFTIRAMDGLGGTSDSYRATLSGKRGTVTDIPERHMALVLWDGHEKPERVVRHYLEPEFTTTPAPDVQARFQTVELDDVAHRALRQAAQDTLDEAPTIQTPDVQACDVPDCGGAAMIHLCGEHGALTVEAVEQREQHLVDTIAKLGKEIVRLEAKQPAPDVQAEILTCPICGSDVEAGAREFPDEPLESCIGRGHLPPKGV